MYSSEGVYRVCFLSGYVCLCGAFQWPVNTLVATEENGGHRFEIITLFSSQLHRRRSLVAVH